MIVRRLYNLPEWELWKPMLEIERMRREMDSLLGSRFGVSSRIGSTGVFPLINLTENKDAYFVRAELPGLKAEELEISVTGNNLTISGERKIASEGEKAKYHRKEREAGKFSRIIGLEKPVDANRVEAALVNGILTVKLPIMEKAKPRQITVK